MCEWRSIKGVTRIAMATVDPLADATVVVEYNGGADDVVLSGLVNDISIAERKETVPVIPVEYKLAQNYPNPFNPVTSIEYALPEAAKVRVEVYNVLGQVIDVLVDSNQEAGFHKVVWDATDMASGVYFYQITANTFTSTKRMVLMK
jgi:hypothetical protein